MAHAPGTNGGLSGEDAEEPQVRYLSGADGILARMEGVNQEAERWVDARTKKPLPFSGWPPPAPQTTTQRNTVTDIRRHNRRGHRPLGGQHRQAS